MVDLKIGSDGDLEVTNVGDIMLTNSVVQAVKIRLRWIYNEWKLGPDYGFRWFEEVLVKNPNLVKIKSLIRTEIIAVDGVTDAAVDDVAYNPAERTVAIRFTVYVGEQIYRDEVTI